MAIIRLGGLSRRLGGRATHAGVVGRSGRGGSVVAGSSALAVQAASMSSGQWADFTMGGLDLTLLDVGSSHSVNEYCARGHWDPIHKKIQFWGQGHNSETKFLTWDDATNAWSATSAEPYAYAGVNVGHAYYHQALDPATGDVYLRRYNSGIVHKKPYGSAWTTATSHSNLYNQIGGGLEWFPALNGGAGGLVFIDTGSAQSSNSTVTSWTTRQDPLSPTIGAHSNWIAAAGGYCYFGGGIGSTAMFRMDSSGTVTSQPSTPLVAGIWAEAATGLAPVIAHPDGTQLLLFESGASGGAIHKFNGTSWASNGTHSIPADQWWCVPVSDYGVVVFVCQDTGVSSPVAKVYKP